MKTTLKISMMALALSISVATAASANYYSTNDVKKIEQKVDENSIEFFEQMLESSSFAIPKFKVMVYDEKNELIFEKAIENPALYDDAELNKILRKADFIVESNGTLVYKISKS